MPRTPNHRAEICTTGLRLGEQVVPLYCGAVHYFRLPRIHWHAALEQVRALGLTFVETYVPWGVHELSDGAYDFGEHDDKLDLCAFLDVAHALGLYVFLRPGPNVNAELTYFGLPERVVLDPECQALSPDGTCVPLPVPPRAFPVPSYASKAFRAHSERWLRAVAALTASRCWPDGPIALIQVDNEAALYFRDAPFDSDYHPDSLAQFRRDLAARYGEPSVLAQLYERPIDRFEAVMPPVRFEATRPSELPPYLDWAEHQQALVCGALTDMSAVLRDTAFGALPFVHNLPMGEGGLPAALAAVGKTVDLVGLDYYHGRNGLEQVRRRTQRLVGCTQHAFAPELGFGAPPWFPLRKDSDSVGALLTACAYGLRGFNLYMTVDRDRWYGAPLDAQGAPRVVASYLQRVLAALAKSEHHALTRKAEVALCIPNEYVKLSRMMHMTGALSPSALDVAGMSPSSACRTDTLGFEQPIQLAWHALLMRLDEALCDEHVPFVYVEGETDLSALPDLKLVITPSYELADKARWQNLERFAAGGGQVVYGPRLPELDERVRPHAFAPLGARVPMSIGSATDAKRLVRELVRELDLARPFPVEPAPLRSAVHVDRAGRARSLFLVHPGPSDLVAEVRIEGSLACVDPLSQERFAGSHTLSVPMRARTCRMLVIELEEGAR
jgi:beta-galactosidase